MARHNHTRGDDGARGRSVRHRAASTMSGSELHHWRQRRRPVDDGFGMQPPGAHRPRGEVRGFGGPDRARWGGDRSFGPAGRRYPDEREPAAGGNQLRTTLASLVEAVRHVGLAGDDGQQRSAGTVLDEAIGAVYRILADGPAPTRTDDDAAASPGPRADDVTGTGAAVGPADPDTTRESRAGSGSAPAGGDDGDADTEA